MKARCVCAFAYLAITVTTNANEFTWFTAFPTNSSVSGVAREPKDRSVVVGTFVGTATLGTNQLTSVGDSDLFVAGLDQNGNIAWAQQAGGTGSETIMKVAYGWDGSVFITGDFSGVAKFGTNIVSALSSNGSSDIYIARLSSAGEFLWVRTVGAEQSSPSFAMNVAPNANRVWITGNNLGSLFARSYDFNGNVVNHFMPTTSQSTGSGIAVDTNGDVCITGHFFNSLDFGVTNFTGSGAGSAFTARFTPAGALLWAAAYSPINRSLGFDIALAPNGEVVSVGNVDATYLGAPAPTLFVWKFSANGEEIWLRQKGERRSVYTANTVAVDERGNIYTFGKKSDAFSNPDPRSGPFLTAWTSNGMEAVLLRIPGSQPGESGTGSGIAVDVAGNAWLAGTLQGAFDFGTNHVVATNTLGFVTILAPVMQPRLKMQPGTNANSVVLSWPAAATGFTLRATDQFPGTDWSVSSVFPVVVSNRAQVTLTATNTAQYFELQVP